MPYPNPKNIRIQRILTRVRRRAGAAAVTTSIVALLFALPLWISTGPQTASASTDAPTGVTSSTGVIAYTTGNHEIWVVNADGTDERKLWEVPEHRRDAMMGYIRDLQWNKDGARLAFTSGHEPLCSMYERNVYVINADGSGFQRVTNRPTCDEMASLPTGMVEVEIHNQIGSVGDILIVQIFVEGAPEPENRTFLGPGTRQITIPNVPDLGPGVSQSVVVVSGSERWYSIPGVDVIAGETVDAGTLTLNEGGRFSNLLTWSLSWSPDGTELGFLLGPGLSQRVLVDADAALHRSNSLLNATEQHAYAGDLAWSPLDNTILFQAPKPDGTGFGIYKATAGSNAPAELLLTTDLTRGISWTPDGKGFVVSNYTQSLLMEPIQANIFYVDLATTAATNLTNYENSFGYYPSVSPDGQHVIFEYLQDTDPDTLYRLQKVPIGGGEPTAFGPAGVIAPGWGAGSVVPPAPPGDENDPPDDENNPPDDENNPPDDENDPPDDENNPPDDENNPPGDENEPPGNENDPPGNGTSSLYLPLLQQR